MNFELYSKKIRQKTFRVHFKDVATLFLFILLKNFHVLAGHENIMVRVSAPPFLPVRKRWDLTHAPLK